jgi:cation diffusion facilitator CzcD-associated flavoprotein CzcO
MSQTATTAERPAQETEHFDVVIVGAGISGIGGAYHLTTRCADQSFVVLEAKEGFGGTWHTHRYPGVRSDSDLYTFGYRFKPWTSAPIASGDEILKYLNEVIDDNDLGRHIRYQHTITSASWSSDEHVWTLDVTRTDTGEALQVTAGFLWMCQGYYRHDQGYTPDWPGLDRYTGTVVHPQTWPEDLDYAGKDVVVIGSGATAATLVPAIAADVHHVTVLQRSPTYYFAGQNVNELADTLRAEGVDEMEVHERVRNEILEVQRAMTQLCFDEPELARDALIEGVRAYLGPDYDIETHFTPRYLPWRQRLALVPDGDLFVAITSGQASMVTDEIDTFTEDGIRLTSGQELRADIVVTATGFNLSVLGDIPFSVDGDPLDLSDTVTYRGMMFTGVPNLVWVFGYFRASWTLRVDLIADFVCHLLDHMAERGATTVTPALRPEDADMEILDWVDPENFNPGYLMRGAARMPKRGSKPEWEHSQDYWVEKDVLPTADLEDGCLVYE